MTAETLTLLTEPQRDTCEICGSPTELKDYIPRTAVCLVHALEAKDAGHRQAKGPDYRVTTEPDENVTSEYWQRIMALRLAGPTLPPDDTAGDPEPL